MAMRGLVGWGLLLAACTSSPGSPSPAAATTAAPVMGGSCDATLQNQACTAVQGIAIRMQCSTQSHTWALLQACASAEFCWEQSGPTAPAAKSTLCATSGPYALVDAGASDAGTTAPALGDASPADASDATAADAGPVLCGNGACDPGEASTCAKDCPPAAVCGDLTCAASETKLGCGVDCGKFMKGKQTCAEASCKSAWTACLHDAGCVAFYNCLSGCQGVDPTCIVACLGAVPPATDLLRQTLEGCLKSNCKNAWTPPCGDGECTVYETGCPADCPPVCGDGVCSVGENATCIKDCVVCGDAQCSASESAATCPEDCGG